MSKKENVFKQIIQEMQKQSESLTRIAEAFEAIAVELMVHDKKIEELLTQIKTEGIRWRTK